MRCCCCCYFTPHCARPITPHHEVCRRPRSHSECRRATRSNGSVTAVPSLPRPGHKLEWFADAKWNRKLCFPLVYGAKIQIWTPLQCPNPRGRPLPRFKKPKNGDKLETFPWMTHVGGRHRPDKLDRAKLSFPVVYTRLPPH